MNAAIRAYSALGTEPSAVRTDRGTEYEVFLRVTRELKILAKDPNGSFPRLVASLHRNRSLWTLLATEVSSPDNQLPEELRAKIFYLSEFVSHQTSQILSKKSDVQVLIDLNLTVMKGLGEAGGSK